MAEDSNVSSLIEVWASSSKDNLDKMTDALQKIRSKQVGTPSSHAELLRKCRQEYDDIEEFLPGDLVTWKDGLRDRLHPEPGWPAIVLEVFELRVKDPTPDTQSASFRRFYDILGGVLIDGVMYTFHFESRRLKRFEAESA
jgi:hypothetical protein